MFGQVAIGVVLLAIGCNMITGVGDLKIAADCSPDGGRACDAGTGVTTGEAPLEPVPSGSAGAAGLSAPDAGPGVGSGGDECAANQDLPFIGTPSNVFGNDLASACGARITSSGAGGMSGIAIAAGETGGGETGGQNDAGPGGADTAPPMPGAVSGSIAAACATDGDCADGLTCTTSADSGGPFSNGAEPVGPQNGYCSRSCNTDAECQAADSGAICLGPGNGRNHCYASCDATRASFPTQCNARDDLTCVPLASDPPRAYCAPACHDDAGCTPRFCNLSTGLCQDEPHTGKPIGAGCTSKDECAAGACFALRGQPSVCTGLCTFGSTAGCGFAADAAQRDAACLDTLSGNGVGPGLCTELCDTDADCEQQAAGWVCTPWSIDVLLDYALTYDRIGFCELPPARSAGGSGNTGKCSEDCPFAGDGLCEDGGPGSITSLCPLGTDCTDCGAR